MLRISAKTYTEGEKSLIDIEMVRLVLICIPKCNLGTRETDINGKNIYDGTMIPQYIPGGTSGRVNNKKNAMGYLNYKDIP